MLRVTHWFACYVLAQNAAAESALEVFWTGMATPTGLYMVSVSPSRKLQNHQKLNAKFENSQINQSMHSSDPLSTCMWILNIKFLLPFQFVVSPIRT